MKTRNQSADSEGGAGKTSQLKKLTVRITVSLMACFCLSVLINALTLHGKQEPLPDVTYVGAVFSESSGYIIAAAAFVLLTACYVCLYIKKTREN